MNKYCYNNCAVVVSVARFYRTGRELLARVGLNATAGEPGCEGQFLHCRQSFALFLGEGPWDAPVTLGPGGGDAGVAPGAWEPS